jgi:hypothetical protein
MRAAEDSVPRGRAGFGWTAGACARAPIFNPGTPRWEGLMLLGGVKAVQMETLQWRKGHAPCVPSRVILPLDKDATTST